MTTFTLIHVAISLVAIGSGFVVALTALHALAPTQTESPFKVAQLAVLVLFMVLGALSVKKFRAQPIL